MRTVMLGVKTQNDGTRGILAAAHGQRCAGDDRISSENIGELCRVSMPSRMEIVRTKTEAGPLTIREEGRASVRPRF